MSSNFLIDNIHKTPIISRQKNIYEKILQEMAKNKKYMDELKEKIRHHDNKKNNSVFNNRRSANLEEKYKISLILLEAIKKQKENNVFNKYDIQQNTKHIIKPKNISYGTVEDRNNRINESILMKKKFLMNFSQNYHLKFLT